MSASMTAFHWIRHASHDLLGARLAGRLPGVSLNARGSIEAHRLATWLSGARIQSLYTSPLERCVETASAIGGAIHRPPHVLTDLTEIDFGVWTGRSFGDLAGDPGWDRFNTRRSEALVPGGETMREAEERALACMTRLQGLHRGETIALVSHGDVIKAVLAHVLGAGLDHMQRFDVDPASVSTLVHDGGGWRVVAVNESPAPAHERIQRTDPPALHRAPVPR